MLRKPQTGTVSQSKSLWRQWLLRDAVPVWAAEAQKLREWHSCSRRASAPTSLTALQRKREEEVQAK